MYTTASRKFQPARIVTHYSFLRNFLVFWFYIVNGIQLVLFVYGSSCNRQVYKRDNFAIRQKLPNSAPESSFINIFKDCKSWNIAVGNYLVIPHRKLRVHINVTPFARLSWRTLK